MNDRMKQEMERTIQMLQASMPKKNNRATVGALLRLSVEELNRALLLVLFGCTILFGSALAQLLSQSMLTVFFTAPLPGLFLFRRYVFHGNKRMRELEETFCYSYSEMLIGRTTVISLYMLAELICLALVLCRTNGTDFFRLALCGAIPSIYLCALLLLLGSTVRHQETVAAIAVVLWMGLAFFALYLPVEQFLCQLHTLAYGAAAGFGLIFYGGSIHKTKAARDFYVADFG